MAVVRSYSFSPCGRDSLSLASLQRLGAGHRLKENTRRVARESRLVSTAQADFNVEPCGRLPRGSAERPIDFLSFLSPVSFRLRRSLEYRERSGGNRGGL